MQCGCGCGETVGQGKRFRHGHHNRIRARAARKSWEDYPPPVRDVESGCLRWQGPLHSHGYGKIGSKQYAHHEAWEREVGPIPPGMTMDHVAARGCRYRDCVAVEHLEPVPHAVNVQRTQKIIDQLAKVRCPKGHLYAGHNLIIRRGKRECRRCTYDRNARNRARRRAERRCQPLGDAIDG